MKAKAKTLIMLLLVGLIGSSCTTLSRVTSENKEELGRVEKMSPQEKAEWERAERDKRLPGNLPNR